MIYILIFVLSQYQKPSPGVAVEFNTLEACRAAASEIVRQARAADDGQRVHVLVCAAKGVKP